MYEVPNSIAASAGYRQPVATQTSKYDAANGFLGMEDLELVDGMFASQFSGLVRSAYSYATWKQNRSVLRKISRLQEEFGLDLCLPWCHKKTLNFMMASRELGDAASTITTAVSRVRTLHKLMGMEAMVPTHWTSTLLKAMSIQDKTRVSMKRLPVTPEVMLTIKRKLSVSAFNEPRKRLVWLAATLLFNCSLRPGEIFTATRSGFVPGSTLLLSDIKLGSVVMDGKQVATLLLTLRNTKEMRSGGCTVVETFYSGKFFCAYTALEKYLRSTGRGLSEDEPLMWTGDGGYTNALFNADLRSLLHDVYDYSKEGVLGHSFRSGVATALARLGYSDSDIMEQGRWSSAAFLNYVKRGRATRLNKQYRIFQDLVMTASDWI